MTVNYQGISYSFHHTFSELVCGFRVVKAMNRALNESRT